MSVGDDEAARGSGWIHLLERERRHTGRELHDGICQTLGALVLDLIQLEESLGRPEVETHALLQDAIHMAKRACDETRRVARGLRPALLDEQGLEPAVDELVRDFQNHARVQVTLEIESGLLLEKDTELLVYRTIQEALNNVRKHASARNAWVQVHQTETRFEVVITDDGRGTAAGARTPGGGVGIAGLRERAAIAGGSLDLKPAPGRGTILCLWLEPRPRQRRTRVTEPPTPHAP